MYQIADCMLRCAAAMCLCLCLCAGRREGRHIPYFAVVYRTPRDFTAVDLLGNKIVTDITLYITLIPYHHLTPGNIPSHNRCSPQPWRIDYRFPIENLSSSSSTYGRKPLPNSTPLVLPFHRVANPVKHARCHARRPHTGLGGRFAWPWLALHHAGRAERCRQGRRRALWHLCWSTARVHAHPCPAVISVQAPGRVVVWGIRGWFAGEPGDGVPKLPLLTWLTPINALFALLCRGVSGLTVAPFPLFPQPPQVM